MNFTTVTVNRGGRRSVVRDAGGPQPLYVYRQVLDPAPLLSWARSAGLRDLHDAGDLHVTVVYSKTPVDWFRLVGDPYGTDVVGGSPATREVRRRRRAQACQPRAPGALGLFQEKWLLVRLRRVRPSRDAGRVRGHSRLGQGRGLLGASRARPRGVRACQVRKSK